MNRHIKEIIKELRKEFRGIYRLNEPLWKHTTFRIGGSVDLWTEPKDIGDIQFLIKLIKKYRVPFFILGGGSNILVKDRGFSGVIIHLNSPDDKNISLASSSRKGVVLDIGSAASIKNLLDFCVKFSLTGCEFMTGIPGRLGGSLVMNAGVSPHLKNKDDAAGNIGNLVEEVKVMDSQGKLIRLNKESLKFGYRQSNLSRYIILSAKLKLYKGKKDAILKRCQDLLRYRRASQDFKYPSCGCIFKNPSLSDLKVIDNKLEKNNLSAGRLIDLCNLKGRRIGGAEISSKHANFIVNVSNASCEDVLGLMRIINREVKERFGIKLEPEIKII